MKYRIRLSELVAEKAIRENRHLSLNKMAEETGMNRRMLAYYNTGQTAPVLGNFLLMAEYLNVETISEMIEALPDDDEGQLVA